MVSVPGLGLGTKVGQLGVGPAANIRGLRSGVGGSCGAGAAGAVGEPLPRLWEENRVDTAPASLLCITCTVRVRYRHLGWYMTEVFYSFVSR